MAALARREVKDHGNGRFLAALTQAWAERGHHLRGTNGAVRLTYAEAWMCTRVDEREQAVPYLDFAANRWNSQLMLCAFIENERHEALVAVERALAVGDTIILTPWMAVAVIVENLPAHARDVVNLTLREPFTLIQDHAGLPVSAFQSLLGTCSRLFHNLSPHPGRLFIVRFFWKCHFISEPFHKREPGTGTHCLVSDSVLVRFPLALACGTAGRTSPTTGHPPWGCSDACWMMMMCGAIMNSARAGECASLVSWCIVTPILLDQVACRGALEGRPRTHHPTGEHRSADYSAVSTDARRRRSPRRRYTGLSGDPRRGA